jgi:hypothetical protein
MTRRPNAGSGAVFRPRAGPEIEVPIDNPLRYHRRRPPPARRRRRPAVSSAPTAKFFVNQGVVSSRIDMQNLLRPLLKQTVSYRYHRGRDLVAYGTGWVERIVVDDPETSTYFTPISISLNVDSFEHLEFDTRPDQLLVYALVQGDERVIIEYAPLASADDDRSGGARQLSFDTSGFVQMELQGLGADDVVGDPVMDGPEPARRLTDLDEEA